MSTNSNQVMDLFKWALNGLETQYAGLHTFHQDRARQYESVIQDAANQLEPAEIYVARPWILRASIDAVIKNDEWVDRGWSARPQKFYPFDRVELGHVPMPELVTIPSFTSTNTLVILTNFCEVNDRGYGDHATATYYSIAGVRDSAQDAEDFARNFVRAVRFVTTILPSLNAEVGEARPGAWRDTPDF